ncbi:competence protein [Streptococcus pneumoniae]|nr:competence protein [Streptococcus pneumoniae]
MSQLLISEVRYQQQSEQKEWLLFVDQLEAELDRSQFEKVEGNRLYMKQDGKDIAIGKSKSDDFRKTDALLPWLNEPRIKPSKKVGNRFLI